MKNTRNKCPICLQSSFTTLRHFTFIVPEGHPISEGYDLVLCESCGFVFAQINAQQKDYDEFYEKVSKYADSTTSTGSGEADWEKKRFLDTTEVIAQHLSNKGANILDIGCANGGQLMALREKDFVNLYGIDPSESCAIQCQQKGLAVHRGSISNHNLTTNFFDCVILSHVLEHIVDLQATIKELEKLVKENGILYIEVPDANRYKDFLFSPFQDINTEHINHFSVTNLKTLFSKWEFVATGEKNIFSSPDCPYPALYCVFRKKSPTHFDEQQFKDEILSKNIKEYLEKSVKLLEGIDEILRARLDADSTGKPEVIVWGTGQLAMKLLSETCLTKFNIVGFVDGNPINQGRLFLNSLIIAPDEVKKFSSTIPIIITSTLHQIEILEVIKRLKLPNPILTIK